jgi:hypothetical protein
MKTSKLYSTFLISLLLLSGCNGVIDFVTPGFSVMLIIGAIVMFVLFLIGSISGLLTTDKKGKSNFEPEGLIVVIVMGIFLFSIFGDGCN